MSTCLLQYVSRPCTVSSVAQSTGTALRDLDPPPALKLDLTLDGASCAELLAERDASFSGSGDSMHSGFTGAAPFSSSIHRVHAGRCCSWCLSRLRLIRHSVIDLSAMY